MSLMSRYRKPKPAPTPTTPAPSSNGTGPLLLTLKQAETYLGLPIKNIREHVHAGEIKIAPARAKGWRIARAELDRFAREMFEKSHVYNGERNRSCDWNAWQVFRRMSDAQLREFFAEER